MTRGNRFGTSAKSTLDWAPNLCALTTTSGAVSIAGNIRLGLLLISLPYGMYSCRYPSVKIPRLSKKGGLWWPSTYWKSAKIWFATVTLGVTTNTFSTLQQYAASTATSDFPVPVGRTARDTFWCSPWIGLGWSKSSLTALTAATWCAWSWPPSTSRSRLSNIVWCCVMNCDCGSYSRWKERQNRCEDSFKLLSRNTVLTTLIGFNAMVIA